MNISDRHRALTEAAVLDASAVITRTGPGVYDEETGLITATDATVWEGPCSVLSPASTDRSDPAGGDVLINNRVALIPCRELPPVDVFDDTPRDPDAIAAGDILTVNANDDDPGDRYIIERIDTRTHEVLRRLRVVEITDAQGVPA